MDFAKKQLEKYGWTAGKGLGKNENGIAEALRPKLKKSVTGVGHDAASDFTEHWWNDLYNKAASNLEVEEINGKIKIKDPSGFEISNKIWQINKKKGGDTSEHLYANNFVRKSILSKGGSKVENIEECDSRDDQTKKLVLVMTDEDLYAACEGRTAHKGARHGLKALGKLARIEQQEKSLLNQAKYIDNSHAETSKEKKHLKSSSQLIVNNDLKSNDITFINIKKERKQFSNEKQIEHCTNRNKTCLKNKTKKVDCTKEEQTILSDDISDKNILVLKKKKSKRKDFSDLNDKSNGCKQMGFNLPKKKKMEKNSIVSSNINIPTVQNNLVTDSLKRHKKKKKK